MKEQNNIQDYVKAVFTGAYAGAMDLVNTVLHPVDELLYPISMLAFDAGILFVGSNLVITGKYPELTVMQNQVWKNPQIYHDAVARMQERGSNLKAFGQAFLDADGPQKVEIATQTAVSILAPGWIVKGVKVAANLHHFGVPYNPPKFHNVTTHDLIIPPPPLTKITLADIRKQTTRQEYMYVITENRELIITADTLPQPFLKNNGTVFTFVAHPEIANLLPVYSSGWVVVEKILEEGQIVKINNFSGHYLPFGKDLRKIVEKTFIRTGFKEARGKFESFDLSPVVTPTTKIGNYTPIVTQDKIRLVPSVTLTLPSSVVLSLKKTEKEKTKGEAMKTTTEYNNNNSYSSINHTFSTTTSSSNKTSFKPAHYQFVSSRTNAREDSSETESPPSFSIEQKKLIAAQLDKLCSGKTSVKECLAHDFMQHKKLQEDVLKLNEFLQRKNKFFAQELISFKHDVQTLKDDNAIRRKKEIFEENIQDWQRIFKFAGALGLETNSKTLQVLSAGGLGSVQIAEGVLRAIAPGASALAIAGGLSIAGLGAIAVMSLFSHKKNHQENFVPVIINNIRIMLEHVLSIHEQYFAKTFENQHRIYQTLVNGFAHLEALVKSEMQDFSVTVMDKLNRLDLLIQQESKVHKNNAFDLFRDRFFEVISQAESYLNHSLRNQPAAKIEMIAQELNQYTQMNGKASFGICTGAHAIPEGMNHEDSSSVINNQLRILNIETLQQLLGFLANYAVKYLGIKLTPSPPIVMQQLQKKPDSTISSDTPGADINAQLFLAISKGQEILPLLDAGANIESVLAANNFLNSTGFEGYTPLLLAALFGNRNAIRLLIERGANLRATTAHKQSLLYLLAHAQQFEMIQELFTIRHNEMYWQLNSVTIDGNTPLHSSTFGNSIETAKLLLKLGANKSLKNSSSKTALEYAIHSGHNEVAEIIGNHHYEEAINDQLFHAIVNKTEISPILDAGANIEARLSDNNFLNSSGFSGYTPLLLAAFFGNFDAVKKLVSRSADVNAKTKHNQGLLYLSAYTGQIDIINYLFSVKSEEMKRQLNSENQDKNTPLHSSTYTAPDHPQYPNAIRTTRRLLDLGANPELKNTRGRTAEQYANALKHFEVAQVIKEHQCTKAKAIFNPMIWLPAVKNEIELRFQYPQYISDPDNINVDRVIASAENQLWFVNALRNTPALYQTLGSNYQAALSEIKQVFERAITEQNDTINNQIAKRFPSAKKIFINITNAVDKIMNDFAGEFPINTTISAGNCHGALTRDHCRLIYGQDYYPSLPHTDYMQAIGRPLSQISSNLTIFILLERLGLANFQMTYDFTIGPFPNHTPVKIDIHVNIVGNNLNAQLFTIHRVLPLGTTEYVYIDRSLSCRNFGHNYPGATEQILVHNNNAVEQGKNILKAFKLQQTKIAIDNSSKLGHLATSLNAALSKLSANLRLLNAYMIYAGFKIEELELINKGLWNTDRILANIQDYLKNGNSLTSLPMHDMVPEFEKTMSIILSKINSKDMGYFQDYISLANITEALQYLELLKSFNILQNDNPAKTSEDEINKRTEPRQSDVIQMKNKPIDEKLKKIFVHYETNFLIWSDEKYHATISGKDKKHPLYNELMYQLEHADDFIQRTKHMLCEKKLNVAELISNLKKINKLCINIHNNLRFFLPNIYPYGVSDFYFLTMDKEKLKELQNQYSDQTSLGHNKFTFSTSSESSSTFTSAMTM